MTVSVPCEHRAFHAICEACYRFEFREQRNRILSYRAEHGNVYVCPCCDLAHGHERDCPWPAFERPQP